MPIFKCLKPDCGFHTSGFIRDITSNERWCPRCSSPLIQCNHCNGYVSATINERGETICDCCGKAVAPEYAQLTKPWHKSFVEEKANALVGAGIEPVDFKCTITIDGVPYEL